MEAKLFRLDELKPRELAPGVRVRFVHSEHITVAHWIFAAGAPLREHSHPHEQITNIIEGEFEMTVGGETLRLGPRSVVIIPPNVVHSGRALSRTYALDVFYPLREDYR